MDSERHDTAPPEDPRRPPKLSRRRFLVLGAAAAATLTAALVLHRGETGSSSPDTAVEPTDFPILSVEGGPPGIAARDWIIAIDGLVEQSLRIDHDAWLALPRSHETTSLHCVEGWGAPDLAWEGVRVGDLLARVVRRPEARFVSFHAHGDSYARSLSLAEALSPGVLLADRLDGAPLPAAHGGPLRLVVPGRLGYEFVKWVARVEVTAQPHQRP